MILHRYAGPLALLLASVGSQAATPVPDVVPLDMFMVPEGLEVILWAQSP